MAPRLRLEVLNGTATDDSVTCVLAHIGTQVVISCKMIEAYTGGNLQVFWSTSSISTMRKSITEVLLVIDNVDSQDAGDYSCYAVNNVDAISVSVNLVVIDPEVVTMDENDSNSAAIGTVHLIGVCLLVIFCIVAS